MHLTRLDFVTKTRWLASPFIPYSTGIDFRRQNLTSVDGIDFGRQNQTSVDVRFWRLKSIPAQ